MKGQKFEVKKLLLGIKKNLKKPYVISAVAVFVVVACVTTTVCISATEKEGADVPGLSTEISEAPTEVPTEEYVEETVPVEEPVEEPTEALVEEPVEFNYIPRDSIIEGTPIDFTQNQIVSNLRPDNFLEYNISVLSEKTILKVARSTEELEAALSVLNFYIPAEGELFRSSPEFDKYDDSFFSENALIIKLNGWVNTINSIVISGSELCIEGIDYKYKPSPDGTSGDASQDGFPVRYKYSLTEIKKSDLDGIDTVSFCYREVTVE